MALLVELLNEKIATEIEKRYRAENEAARLRAELKSAEARLRSLESSTSRREAIVQAQGAALAAAHGEDPTWERRQLALEGERDRAEADRNRLHGVLFYIVCHPEDAERAASEALHPTADSATPVPVSSTVEPEATTQPVGPTVDTRTVGE